jgi:hypothetical protein
VYITTSKLTPTPDSADLYADDVITLMASLDAAFFNASMGDQIAGNHQFCALL